MIQDRLKELTKLTERSLANARAGRRLMAAVSGGADSVCLLLCACALREKGYALSAAHVRHDLRETAGEDEAFVRDLCGRLNVPFYAASVHVPRTGSVEDRARTERYRALGRMCREAGADVLLLAHHRNDQAETVLMRLIRGAGAEGLSAMKKRTVREGLVLVRPFLSVSADAIRSALREIGQPWREDETNGDIRYTRNYLRRRILAPLEAAFPGSVGGLCRSAEILGAENDLMDELARKALGQTACLELPCRFLLRDRLSALHPALQRRVIRLFLSECGPQAGFDKTEEIRRALQASPAAVNLDGGGAVVFSPGRLHFIPAQPVRWAVPDGFFAGSAAASGPGDGVSCQAFPESVWAKAEVRLPRPGDLFQPFGHQKADKLSRFLIDRKTDRPFRAFIPLICRENVVLWIPGVAASEQLRLRPGEPSVFVTVRGRLPWQLPQETRQEDTSYGNHSAHL